MHKIKHFIFATLLAGVSIAPAQAGIIFYTDYAAFTAAAGGLTTIDFEGIVGDSGAQQLDSHTFGNTTFTPSNPGSSLICGKNTCYGSPFDSATYVANFNTDLDITFGGGVTAGGGFFGDLDGPGFEAIFNVYDAFNNLIDTQVQFLGDFGAGLAHNFLGWISDGGDEISKININVGGNTWLALDDFGVSDNVRGVPEAGTLMLMALGLLGMGLSSRRKKYTV